jgi:hypothetical protein
MTGTCMAVMSGGTTTNYVPSGTATGTDQRNGTMSTCLSACATQTKWDLACRIEHCHNAMGTTAGSAALHCPHAVGEGLCADNP